MEENIGHKKSQTSRLAFYCAIYTSYQYNLLAYI